jgi:hypothetical protein
MEIMFKQLLFSTALVSSLMMTGCATRTPQAFEKDSDVLSVTSHPVYLMTATIKNDYKDYYEPHLLVVNIVKAGATDSSGRLNFTMDDKARWDENDSVDGNKYLLRMQLPPGQYELVGLTALTRRFPIAGSYFVPIHAQLEVRPGGDVFYIGHVDATVRERKGNEFKAGASIPLIDQAVVGASSGTFDVTISDAFDTEEAVFRGKFNGLKQILIQRKILPPWDRALAQSWWEAH